MLALTFLKFILRAGFLKEYIKTSNLFVIMLLVTCKRKSFTI